MSLVHLQEMSLFNFLIIVSLEKMKRTCYDKDFSHIFVGILIYSSRFSSFVRFYHSSVLWATRKSIRREMKVQCQIANGTNLELYSLMILETCSWVLMAVDDRKLQNTNVITCCKYSIVVKQKSSLVSAFLML